MKLQLKVHVIPRQHLCVTSGEANWNHLRFPKDLSTILWFIPVFLKLKSVKRQPPADHLMVNICRNVSNLVSDCVDSFDGGESGKKGGKLFLVVFAGSDHPDPVHRLIRGFCFGMLLGRCASRSESCAPAGTDCSSDLMDEDA